MHNLPHHLFDPYGDVLIVDRRLPHWSQAGAIAFITWRTLDSMPQPVLDRWYKDRADWLLMHRINPQNPDWRRDLLKLDRPLIRSFLDSF